MTILPIVTAPDSRLTQKSLPIEMVTDEVRKFLNDMVEAMYHNDGAGLAAVQVGVLKRILVIDLKNSEEVEREKDFYPIFMINPEIIVKSQELTIEKEGCISLPEQRIEIARPEHIKVRFLDYNNNSRELETNDWLARVIQHEMDHLDGKLMIDYLSPLKKDVAVRRLRKLKNDIV